MMKMTLKMLHENSEKSKQSTRCAMKEIKPKEKAMLYVRVASRYQADQESRKAEQLRTLTEYCRKNEIEVTGTYVDYGSGQTTDRPELQRMLADLNRPDNETSIVLFTRWDRISRNCTAGSQAKGKLLAMGVTPRDAAPYVASENNVFNNHSFPLYDYSNQTAS